MLHLTYNHSIKSPKFKVATTLFHPMWNCVCLMLWLVFLTPDIWLLIYVFCITACSHLFLSNASSSKRKGGKKSIQLSAKKKCFHKVQPHADESSSYIQYLHVGNPVFNANKTWRVGKFSGLGAHGGRCWYLEKWMA